jgi:GntR family transcriptional regulator
MTSGKSESLRSHLLGLVNGGLDPHVKLPTERELAEQFGINRLTVRRVLDGLERDGLVYRVQGAGTFVSSPRISKSVELTSFSEDMRERGLRPGSKLVRAEIEPAGPQIGYALGLSPATEVIHLERIRTADDDPMCLEQSYLPKNLVPGLLDLDLTASLYEILASTYSLRVERAEQTIRATVVDTAAANMLGVPPFSPAFLVERTGFDNRGRPIERAESLYRGDRYWYELTIYR